MVGQAKVTGKRVETPLTKDELIGFIQSVILNEQKEEMEPFYVLDLGVVTSLFDAWTRNLPMVRPFYAVKCNPNPAFLKATNIIGMRVRGEIKEYWINDGMSGSMTFLKYDHDDVICTPLDNYGSNKTSKCKGLKTCDSTVFGPTCDPAETVLTGFQLQEMDVNDWLVFHNMGAYTSSRGNDFNGFKTSAIPTYIAY